MLWLTSTSSSTSTRSGLCSAETPCTSGAWGETCALALYAWQRLVSDLGSRELPQPLGSKAVGVRALAPMRFLGDGEEPGPWCYHIPLWSKPVEAQLRDCNWLRQQRRVSVTLELGLPGLSDLP
jgi:hypothetical protein